MTDTTRQTGRDGSPWAAGAAVFAGSLMLMVGIFQFFQGLVAVLDDEFFVRVRGYTFDIDTTTWGWIHLILGLLIAAAGLFIFTGNPVARFVGIFFAILSAIANFLWLPYYPIWSIIIIAVDVFIIWGLATYRGADEAY